MNEVPNFGTSFFNVSLHMSAQNMTHQPREDNIKYLLSLTLKHSLFLFFLHVSIQDNHTCNYVSANWRDRHKEQGVGTKI